MRIACVYNSNDRGMSGEHWCNNGYRFFKEGLLESGEADVDIIPVDGVIKSSILKGYDAVVLYSLENLEVIGITNYAKVVIARAPDAHNINDEWLDRVDRAGVNVIINHQSPEYVRKFLPARYRYVQVIFGISEDIHKSREWENRDRSKILLTGSIGRDEHYQLRKLCGSLSCVEYVGHSSGYVGNRFGDLLNMYRAAIAACTTTSVYKYFEIPACGCLSFMEVNGENGCEKLGFVDGENAVFINEGNYRERLKEYVKTADDPKWKEIAERGRRLVMELYENKVQVGKLIKLISELGS